MIFKFSNPQSSFFWGFSSSSLLMQQKNNKNIETLNECEETAKTKKKREIIIKKERLEKSF
jgi:hypothetical protein